jgi:glycosyltransferase involved in cell wall biosynthesis
MFLPANIGPKERLSIGEPMANSPLVSIMLPVYNAEAFLASAIDSVLSQAYPHWELILVDDGSTDGSGAIAARYEDPRIKLVHQANAGEAAARNTALQQMQGRWLAFIDADDLWLPHHLEQTVAYLQQHPECSAVYTDGFHIDQDGHQLQSLSSRRRGPFEGWIFEQVVRASDVFGPPLCVVLDRALVEKHQLRYDPRIVIGPDWDFFTRFAEFAYFGYLNEHTCLYRVHLTNITVLTGLQKRAGYLAICREKALELESFEQLSEETRTYVFYDLLVNLLLGVPDEQDRFLEHPQWINLPTATRARILRIMARDTLLQTAVDTDYAGSWLKQSQAINPADRRSKLWWSLFRIHPSLCRAFIRLRRGNRPAFNLPQPFEDIGQ